MANEVENARKNLEADLSDNPYILDDPIGHAITYKKYLYELINVMEKTRKG